MDVYIARQPIFNRNMRVHGYELLYRQSNQNHYCGTDDNRATEELIYNSFLVMDLQTLTEGTLAFINFSKDLIHKQFPCILPPESVVIEVLERGEATQETIEACRQLQKSGYTIALDDFILDDDNLPLIEVADIIKVEYPTVNLEKQQSLIKKYRSRVQFLAEKIETREEYDRALKMGYDYFQGYFFSKPAIIGSKEIHSLPINVIRILDELSSPEPSYKIISSIIEKDLGLSYKLLKLVNSVYYGAKNKINTISHALVYIGFEELRQWMGVLMMKDLRNPENAEAIKLCIIRSKLMELIALELRAEQEASKYFFTGLFSLIDVLMHQPMHQILEGLPLPDEVKEALLGKPNKCRECLDYVIACETAPWSDRGIDPSAIIDAKTFMILYLKALDWAQQLNY
ncbi:MAG: EAL and HDOD domain-containing protein [Anaerovoracaceae bacterium]|jgi:c-di-GMP-related signal transduction protein